MKAATFYSLQKWAKYVKEYQFFTVFFVWAMASNFIYLLIVIGTAIFGSKQTGLVLVLLSYGMAFYLPYALCKLIELNESLTKDFEKFASNSDKLDDGKSNKGGYDV